MVQALINPATRFSGPFRGVNDAVAPGSLTPEFATVARNVSLFEGRVRPRDPWGPAYAGDTLDPAHYPPVPDGGRIIGMYHFLRGEEPFPDRNYSDIILAVTRIEGPPATGGLWALDLRDNPPLPRWVRLREAVPVVPQFLEINGYVYVTQAGMVIDGHGGSTRPIRTQGTLGTTWLAGMDKPVIHDEGVGGDPTNNPDFNNPNAPIHIRRFLQGESGPPTETDPTERRGPLRYAFSLVDADGRESNATVWNLRVGPSGISLPTRETLRIRVRSEGFPSHQQNEHVRVYRRDEINAVDALAYTLMHEIEIPQSGEVVVWDHEPNLPSDSPELLNGPFAKITHGLPPACSCMEYWDGRLWTNDATRFGVIRHSEIALPDAFNDALGVVVLPGAHGEHVAGIRSWNSELYVGRRGGVTRLAGTRHTGNNTVLVTGQAPLDDALDVHETNARRGPTQPEGNGFFTAGTPSRLYYAAVDGFFEFDGLDSVPRSIPIPKLWRRFFDQSDPVSLAAFTYAEDVRTQAVVICNGKHAAQTAGLLLLYHYAAGGWTQWDGDYRHTVGEGRDALDIDPTPTAVAQSIGRRTAPQEGRAYSSMLLAGRYVQQGQGPGVVLRTFDDDAENLPLAPWEYKTGDLMTAKGLRGHVYQAKFLLTGPYGDRFADDDDPLVILGVELDREVEVFQRVPVTARAFELVPVGSGTQRVSLRARSDDRWRRGFARDYGIAGWEMAIEPFGQR